MVLDREVVRRRLAELEVVLEELTPEDPGDALSAADLEADLSRRWWLERGLLAAANLVLDVATHVAAGHFGSPADSYEEALRVLVREGVLSDGTYSEIEGLGGFRNVLAHEYLDVDLEELPRWRRRLLDAAPEFAVQLTDWMEDLGPS